MDGLGELFGRSVDDTLSHLWVATVPLAFNLLALVVGASVFTILAGAPLALGAGVPSAGLEVSVPSSLPSVGEVYDVFPEAVAMGPRAFAAIGAFLLIVVPIAAYAEGGFIHLLARLPPRTGPPGVLGEASEAAARAAEAYGGEPITGPTEAMDAFDEAGRRHFMPLFVFRALLGAILLAVLALYATTPLFRNYHLGVLAVEFVLIFAPYAIVLDGDGPVSAMVTSVTTIATHPAPSLVMLAFGLLTTGGMAALVAPLVAAAGTVGLVITAILYAPVGTALSLYILRVYLSFKPEPLASAEPGDVPVRAPSGG